MRKFLSCLLLTLAFFALLAILATQQAPAERKAADQDAPSSDVTRPGPEPAGPTASDLSDAEDPAVREILRIRRQQGDLLDGTLLESPAPAGGPGAAPSGPGAETEFLRMLQKAAAEAEANRPAPRSAAGSWTACEANYRRRVEAEKGGDDRLVALLRATSRRLDRRANDLEAEQRFDQADQLRDLAEKARREARLLEGFGTPSSGGRPAPSL